MMFSKIKNNRKSQGTRSKKCVRVSYNKGVGPKLFAVSFVTSQDLSLGGWVRKDAVMADGSG